MRQFAVNWEFGRHFSSALAHYQWFCSNYYSMNSSKKNVFICLPTQIQGDILQSIEWLQTLFQMLHSSVWYFWKAIYYPMSQSGAEMIYWVNPKQKDCKEVRFWMPCFRWFSPWSVIFSHLFNKFPTEFDFPPH